MAAFLQWVLAAAVRMPNDKALTREERKQHAVFYKYPQYNDVYAWPFGKPAENTWAGTQQLFGIWINKQLTSQEEVAAMD